MGGVQKMGKQRAVQRWAEPDLMTCFWQTGFNKSSGVHMSGAETLLYKYRSLYKWYCVVSTKYLPERDSATHLLNLETIGIVSLDLAFCNINKSNSLKDISESGPQCLWPNRNTDHQLSVSETRSLLSYCDPRFSCCPPPVTQPSTLSPASTLVSIIINYLNSFLYSRTNSVIHFQCFCC